jgi:hypothetical protein
LLPGCCPGNKSRTTVVSTGHSKQAVLVFAATGIGLILARISVVNRMVAWCSYFDGSFFWFLVLVSFLLFLGNLTHERWVLAVNPDAVIEAQHPILVLVLVTPPESLLGSVSSAPCDRLEFWFTILHVHRMVRDGPFFSFV